MALANLIADLADLGSLGLLRPYFIRGPYDLEKSKNDWFLAPSGLEYLILAVAVL